MPPVRTAGAWDAAALASIYSDAVLHGFGTFEETPPSAEEMEQRRAEVSGYGLPFLVAEVEGVVAGYAYAAPFRTRAAYRYTVEDSVYVHPAWKGRGVGRALLRRVIDDCTALGLRRMLAVIGDSDNTGSIRLHRSMGFTDAGLLAAFGYKHGRWVDVVMMTKSLNGDAAAAPQTAGLALDPCR